MGVAPGRKPGKTARQMANSDDRPPRNPADPSRQPDNDDHDRQQ
jgi:hypothetical protein